MGVGEMGVGETGVGEMGIPLYDNVKSAIKGFYMGKCDIDGFFGIYCIL